MNNIPPFFIILPLLAIVGGLVWYFLIRPKQGGSNAIVTGNSFQFYWSPGMSGNAESFAFPSRDGVHMILRKASGPLSPGKSITFRFRIEGDGVITPADGPPPPMIRLMLQRQGDNMTAGEEHKRLWDRGIEVSNPGEYERNIPLDRSLWTGVFGQHAPEAEFNETLQKIGNIGFSFGGQNAAHGIYCKAGSAHFRLLEFRVS